MIHKHKWIYSQRIEEKPVDRYCEKCGEFQYLYHLEHNGINWYGYKKDHQDFTEEEMKRKEKRTAIIGILLLSGMGFILVCSGPYLSGFTIFSISLFSSFLFIFYLFCNRAWKEILLWSKRVI